MKKKIKLFLLLIVVFSYSSVVNASTYYVTGDGVRIRSSAENTADNVIGKLNYGDKIEVIDLENSWYKIKYGNGYGYITYRYVSNIEDTYVSNTIALLKSKTNLKKSDSSSSKTVIKIPKKAVVKVLKETSKWSLVEYNEKIGYVKTKLLEKYSNTNEEAVGTYTVNYSLSNSSRKKNINKSIGKLNKVVIKPGETFSFINTVGKSGYLKAPEFNKKEKVYGGGLSQVATSLYLSIRDAKNNGCYINVIEQNRYTDITPYAKLGEEAMIDIKNNKDLVFINKSDKTIKIYAKVSGNNISFTISEY